MGVRRQHSHVKTLHPNRGKPSSQGRRAPAQKEAQSGRLQRITEMTENLSQRFNHQTRRLQKMGSRMVKNRGPILGAASGVAAGGAGIAIAAAVGAGELAVGAAAAFVAYRMVRYGTQPVEAFREFASLDQGKSPKKHRE